MADELLQQLTNTQPPANTRRDLLVVAPCTAGTDDSIPANNTYGNAQSLFIKDFAAQFIPSAENRIINGDYLIDQYKEFGVAVLGSSSSDIYPAGDRWGIYDTTGRLNGASVQVVTDAPAGLKNSWKLKLSGASGALSAGQSANLFQAIEGLNVADLNWGTANAQGVMLDFWVKSSVTGTYSVALQNGAWSRSYIATFAVAAANTWTYVVLSIPGDTAGAWATDNTAGIFIFFDLGQGTTFQNAAGAWAAGQYLEAAGNVQFCNSAANSTYQLAGVRLRAGTYNVPRVRRMYSEELRLCQRYFCKTFPPGTVPAQNLGVGVLGAIYAMSPVSARLIVDWPFPVTMRAAPTVTLYSQGDASANWWDNTANVALASQVGESAPARVLITSSADVAGDTYGIHMTARAEL